MKRVQRFVFSLSVCFGLCCGFSHAATVTQTRNFVVGNQTGSGSGTLVFVDGSTGLVGSQFSPFDSSLGTLDSFQIVWSVSQSASGTVASTVVAPSGKGILTPQLNGTPSIAGNRYGGLADSVTVVGDPSDSIPLTTAQNTSDETWLPENAGSTYNPAFLATVTGASDFDLTLTNSSGPVAFVSYTELSSVSADLAGSVTMTYTYTPAAVPEPSTWILGVGAVACGCVVRCRRRGLRARAAAAR